MGVGGSLCPLPPHSESQVPTVFVEVWGKAVEGGRGGLTSAPGKPGAGWVGLRGKEEGEQGGQQCHMDKWRLRASQGPFSGSLAPGDHPTPRPSAPLWKGGESSWSGHPSSPSGSSLCHHDSCREMRCAGLPKTGFQSESCHFLIVGTSAGNFKSHSIQSIQYPLSTCFELHADLGPGDTVL